jgi:peptidoglycan/LPS O-acetylase OafA/YrhL
MVNGLPGKINYLEGIRGIAALMVVGHHFMLAFYPGAYDGNPARAHLGDWDRWYYESPLNVLTNGNFCVTIFYVLSGFVLSRKYWLERNFSIVSSSALRRYFRLIIPVGFVLFLSFLCLQFSAYKHVEVAKLSSSEWWLGTLWPMDSSFTTFLRYLFIDVMFRGSGDYVTSMWTMKTELFGSFLVFGLLGLIHIIKRPFIILTACLVLLFLAKEFYYTGFVIGIILNALVPSAGHQSGFLSTEQNGKRMVKALLLAVLVFAGLILGSYPSWKNFAPFGFWKFVYDLPNAKSILNEDHYIWIHTIGATLVIAAAMLSRTIQRVLASRLFIFLGLISFSLYLLHPLVLGAMACPLFLKLHEGLGYNTAALIAFGVMMAVTFILSWLMAISVDKWAVELPRKWFGSVAVKSRPVPVAVQKKKKGKGK